MGRQNGLVASVSAGKIIVTFTGFPPPISIDCRGPEVVREA
jgi:hypothetical protein